MRSKLEKLTISVISYLVILLVIQFIPGPKSLFLVAFLLGLPVVTSAFIFPKLGGTAAGIISTLLAFIFISQANGTYIPFIGLLYIAVGIIIGLLKTGYKKKSPPDSFPGLKVFRHSQNISLIVSTSDEISKINQRAKEVLGSPKKLSEVFHPHDLSTIRDEIKRALAKEESSRVGLRLISQDKESLPVEFKAIRINMHQVLIEMQDISEVAELEEKLREAEARYRYLIEDAIDTLDTGIFLLDQKNRIIWANRTIENFFNLNRDDLVGMSLSKALRPAKMYFQNEQGYHQALKGGGDGGINISLKPPYGEERILEYRSIPIQTDKYKGGRIDHYIDITEKEKLERDLIEKTKRLQESNQRLEEFTYHVSHDLKEPLRTVEAFSEFLIEDYSQKLDQEGKEYLESMKKQAVRMKDLINDLLKLSRIGRKSEVFEEVDMDEVLREVTETLEYSLEEVELSVEDDLPTIQASKTLTTELFSNLISNGIKYNDKEGKKIEVGWNEENSRYLFYVKDNGIGIDTRYLDKIFELFERLDPRQSPNGTGAGLAICKRIVEEHGGRIWVDSTKGAGSTFYFTIPKRKSHKKGG